MNIDFSYSIEDWMAIIKQFFQIIIDFFKGIGIDIFAEETTTAAPAEGE